MSSVLHHHGVPHGRRGRAGPAPGRVVIRLDLSSVHARLGHSWDQYEESVHRLLACLLRDELGPTKRYRRDDDGYLLTLSDSRLNFAEGRCRKIAKRIGHLLERTAGMPDGREGGTAPGAPTGDAARYPADGAPARCRPIAPWNGGNLLNYQRCA